MDCSSGKGQAAVFSSLTSLTLEIEPVIDFDRVEYVFVLGSEAGESTDARETNPAPAPSPAAGAP